MDKIRRRKVKNKEQLKIGYQFSLNKVILSAGSTFYNIFFYKNLTKKKKNVHSVIMSGHFFPRVIDEFREK